MTKAHLVVKSSLTRNNSQTTHPIYNKSPTQHFMDQNPIVSTNVSFSFQNLNLDDDTVLDAIKFTEEDGVPVVSTSATEQALILGIM